MAFDLNPVAVTAAPLLRALKAGGWASKKDLAERAGRHPNHIQRDLKVLAENGLVVDDAATYPLTPEGDAQLAALDRAADPSAAGAPTALHSDLEPHPLNPRKDFETEEAEEALDELRVSIVKSGLLQPIVVRPKPEPGKWWIVAGERRFRAIGQAILDGDWDEDRPIAITIREVDDRDHLLLALNENLQRSNMSAIEEGVAFNAAVHDFGLSTDELANRTGKSQRYVQQRIALLKLTPEDQDRMRLPKDHPDRLTFKAARAMTQTPREAPLHIGVDLSSQPDVSAEAVISQDDDGRITVESVEREPGSPAEDAAKFGRSLTDREALAFVELVDRSERHPAADPALAAEGYTEVADARDRVKEDLIQKGLMAIRYRGGETPHARPYLMTSGAKAWLEEIGFYDADERPMLLREFRTRVFGIDQALNAAEFGTYSTVWLNPPIAPTGDVGTGRVYRFDPTLTQAEIDEAFAATERRAGEIAGNQPEPEQPALIEETTVEKADRLRRQRLAAEAAADENALQTFVGWMREKLARKREQGFGGWQNPSECKVEDLAAQLVGHVAKGDPVDVAILAMMVGIKAGAMGAPGYLNRLPIPRMERLMIEARASRPIPSEPSEPDPVEDFVEAELEDDEDQNDLGQQSTGDYRPGPGEPAVLIRKSITPDFIVCLEDGRKFKSLKRHLRTRYNLSPEEYRAKWGLPADYPMVAPNYAKARADLARQMGLEPAS